MLNSQEDVRKVYEELCNSYRAIDDFRAKLLGFLPLASATGIFLLVGPDARNLTPATKPFFLAVGTFGFFITLGLFFYELYGVKKCGVLINAGKKLEKDLEIDAQHGQFTARPREVAEVINEPFAAGVIYPAVLAAWTFLALVPGSQDVQWWTTGLAIGVFVIGFTVALFFNLKLGKEEDIRKVLKLRDEQEVTLRHAWKYPTSNIHKVLKMRDDERVTHRHVWKYLKLKKKQYFSDPEGERVSADTHAEVIKPLIDYLKDGRTTLDDVLEKYPTVSREQAAACLEMTLQDIKDGRILEDVFEKYPTISHKQAVDHLEGKTSSGANSN
jgi:hypothetical protein